MYMTTFAQSLAAVNSASVDLCDTVYCDLLYASMIAMHTIDLRVFILPVQSKLTHAYGSVHDF